MMNSENSHKINMLINLIFLCFTYKKLIQRRFQMQEQMNKYFLLKPFKFHLVFVTTLPSSLIIVDFVLS
jgi:hypothetical protein